MEKEGQWCRRSDKHSLHATMFPLGSSFTSSFTSCYMSKQLSMPADLSQFGDVMADLLISYAYGKVTNVIKRLAGTKWRALQYFQQSKIEWGGLGQFLPRTESFPHVIYPSTILDPMLHSTMAIYLILSFTIP